MAARVVARVAIITRTKNRTLLLRRALESVLGQRFADWVMVVVNDGGEPAEVEALLDGYRERFGGRLVVVHNPESLGMEAASNRGIRAVDSEFVVIHDDDDSWHPDFLQRCTAFFDDNPFPDGDYPAHGVVTHSVRCLERIEGERVSIERREPYNGELEFISLYRLAVGNLFPPISFLYRRQVLEEVGYYREDLPVLGDWDFNLRFAERYEIGVIGEPLANYHHRIEGGENRYANSVVSGDGRHRFQENLLCNEYLRRDMARNRVGLGLLVNVGRAMEGVRRRLGLLDALSAAVQRIPFARRLYRRFR